MAVVFIALFLSIPLLCLGFGMQIGQGLAQHHWDGPERFLAIVALLALSLVFSLTVGVLFLMFLMVIVGGGISGWGG